MRAAGQPPDEDHPYGHRKYETVAAASVAAFLLLVVIEASAMRSTTLPAAPVSLRSMASFAIMLATAAVNLFVISYETRAVGRLGSEVLLADAMQTRGDVAGSRWQTMPVPASGSEAHRAIEVKADGQDRVTQGDRSRWGRQKRW